MRHLITGGAGFIGSHLAELLVARGDEVLVLDDLSTGSRDNLAQLDGRRCELVVGSVLDAPLVNRCVDRVDQIFHLAAAVGVRLVVERSVETIVTNTLGTENVLHAAARAGRRIFVASTSEVYGASDQVPFREGANVALGPTHRPRWGYACSKALDEFLAFAYAREQRLQVTVGRFFNTVGPRQSAQYGMVVPRFVRQALAGEPITVYGDGLQTRCFAWVGDVAAGMLKLLETPAARAMVVNLGSEEEVSILALAERVKARTGSRSPLVTVPYAQAYGDDFDDMRRRAPSLDRARELIGYRPTLDLNAILDRVIAHERARLEPIEKAS